MLVVLADTVVLVSLFQSLSVYEEGMKCVFGSALYLAELLCASSSLYVWRRKKLGAVDYCLASENRVEHV